MRSIVDFHTHVLPFIDDGSQSIEESIKMLETIRNNGIERIIATPHFNANRHFVEEFIKIRQDSYFAIKEAYTSKIPQILLGAEIGYYEGISALEDLEKLCIENSCLLLLEMPNLKWSEYTVKELINLSSSGKFTVVIAHVERCLKFQESRVIKILLQSGILFQISAALFETLSGRRKAIKIMKRYAVHFLGSDCHNTLTRPPNLHIAREYIRKRFGDNFLNNFVKFENNLFS